ncbi:MAG TPA: hypothetical protein VGZ02_17960 [Candidatus Baltobacteraceae bacterium]|jgi:hypothetical protein|nr:hypothetical protein [Candidatus Baltobacteraceae bacterium]
MDLRKLALLSSLMATTALTACGGGGSASGSLPPSGGGGGGTQSTQSQTIDSIDAANSVGSPIKDFTDYNESMISPAQEKSRTGFSVRLSANTSGQCSNGIEFFAPDKNGDPNSTERIVFFDNACTEPASDAVRVYTSTGTSSETVHRSVTLYALGSSTPIATRSETNNYTNASYDQYGYPIASGGFQRTSSGNLNINGAKTIDDDSELNVAAASGNTQTFCGDSAGFNATGNQQLALTFGWAGVTPSGTRTLNNDGSVTWNATHTGSVYTGPIGGLSIVVGAQNSSCPISTPMFTLSGGTSKGTYNIPVSATFAYGILTNLTVTNASLPNGDTLNVQTNQGVTPGDIHFISGSLANGSTQIAAFNVNAFGDGTLTVNASGNAYPIVDWHVVR